MTEQDDTIRSLATLIWAVVYDDHSATRRAEALLPRLGIGGKGSAEAGAIEAGLRKALVPPLSGDDSELDRILGDAYTCSRDWSAWELGTMTEEDFEEAAHSPVVDDLIAWRDAAVAAALEVAQTPEEPSLAEQVTRALRDAGFREHRNRMAGNLAAFLVAAGVGVTVRLSWEGASEQWRGRVLAMFASVLRTAGFTVAERDGYLYVPEPKEAGR